MLKEDTQTHFLLSIHRTTSCCKTELSCSTNGNYTQDDYKMSEPQ